MFKQFSNVLYNSSFMLKKRNFLWKDHIFVFTNSHTLSSISYEGSEIIFCSLLDKIHRALPTTSPLHRTSCCVSPPALQTFLLIRTLSQGYTQEVAATRTQTCMLNTFEKQMLNFNECIRVGLHEF